MIIQHHTKLNISNLSYINWTCDYHEKVWQTPYLVLCCSDTDGTSCSTTPNSAPHRGQVMASSRDFPRLLFNWHSPCYWLSFRVSLLQLKSHFHIQQKCGGWGGSIQRWRNSWGTRAQPAASAACKQDGERDAFISGGEEESERTKNIFQPNKNTGYKMSVKDNGVKTFSWLSKCDTVSTAEY